MLLGSESPGAGTWLSQSVPAPELAADLRLWGDGWVRLCMEQDGITQACVAIIDDKRSVRWLAHWPLNVMPHHFSAETLQNVIQQGNIFTYQDHDELNSGCLFPLIGQGKVMGLIGLVSSRTDYFKQGAHSWIWTLSRIISDSLLESQNGSGELQAEQFISRSLQASLDVRDPLPAILKTLVDELKADAVTVLRFNTTSQRFELLMSHGLDSTVLAKLSLFFETGLGGKAVEKRQPIWIDDLQKPVRSHRPINCLDEAGFRGYLAIPLIGHNDLVGALEIVWRLPQPTQMWNENFVTRMAEQIAFAFERSAILKDIRLQNEELTVRYNAVIEGLSRTLELRDLETVGHTRRVSQLTMRLVEHMQIPPDQWDAIRQGALLHDIGKLGIPDAILLKPGSLTPSERKVMQQHAVYGYNILAPIINLRPTLDIARYHHERWDGKGYPYGLMGEQIPLVARLFAVVDVFDALTSDRPYRSAWTHSKALAYIKEQSGLIFDPQVVNFFLEIAEPGN